MNDDIGMRIRAAREARGWSQEFLAAKVGATQSTIDRIESGFTRKSRVLPEISDALELDVSGIPRPQNQGSSTSNLVRVSYVLPIELVDRISTYRNAIGVSSDDEAARRLLDDSLKKQDDFESITGRLISKYRQVKSIREAAGYVLANHPLVMSMSFSGNQLSFTLNDGYTISVWGSGSVVIKKEDGAYYKFHASHAPDWASEMNITNEWNDADIPF